MAKRKQGGIEQIASMPWQAGVLLGLIGYLALRYGIGWYFGAHSDPLSAGIANGARGGMLAPLAGIWLVGCWIGALASFANRGKRRRLLDSQTGIESLRAMRWSEFELLAGEAFRRQGYAVEETGLGGADGGIDLILRKSGQITLVQCKQWQNRQVGVKVVREMYGLLVHHKSAAVKIVALGDYTGDAHRFAQGKPIELIHGGELIATVRSLQTTKARSKGPMDTPLALIGSMVASLFLIAGLSSSTASMSRTGSGAASPVAFQPTLTPQPLPIPHRSTAPTPRAQPVIYASNSQSDAEFREWKKRNAESMKILEKRVKEMPLR
ncbi:restriction endonuclease [Rhodanobacter glycinis]|uniref:restriction endonuclease n=1 Tax=Rhodanobacter glycinis TaxID=582702 RepID=UPI001128C0BF|nr:restriction endonuclease [Rhodanobacter glycinis]TPG45550.1 restriction endonuclease [Rhodanobacter glycinis]